MFPPASPHVVAAAEAALAFALPPLLARLYREVANGGFTRRPMATKRPGRALSSTFEWVDEGLT